MKIIIRTSPSPDEALIKRLADVLMNAGLVGWHMDVMTDPVILDDKDGRADLDFSKLAYDSRMLGFDRYPWGSLPGEGKP